MIMLLVLQLCVLLLAMVCLPLISLEGDAFWCAVGVCLVDCGWAVCACLLRRAVLTVTIILVFV